MLGMLGELSTFHTEQTWWHSEREMHVWAWPLSMASQSIYSVSAVPKLSLIGGA